MIRDLALIWILLLVTAASGCRSQAEDQPRYFSTDSFATLPAGDAALEPVDVAPSLALDVFTEDRRWDAYWRDWKPPSYEVGALASVLFAQSRNKERFAFCVSEWEVCAGYAALPEHALRRSLPRASPIPKDCPEECKQELIGKLLKPSAGRELSAEEAQAASPASFQNYSWPLPDVDGWRDLPPAPEETVLALRSAVTTYLEVQDCEASEVILPGLKRTDTEAWVYLDLPERCGGPQGAIFSMREDGWRYAVAIYQPEADWARGKIEGAGATVLRLP